MHCRFSYIVILSVKQSEMVKVKVHILLVKYYLSKSKIAPSEVRDVKYTKSPNKDFKINQTYVTFTLYFGAFVEVISSQHKYYSSKV